MSVTLCVSAGDVTHVRVSIWQLERIGRNGTVQDNL